MLITCWQSRPAAMVSETFNPFEDGRKVRQRGDAPCDPGLVPRRAWAAVSGPFPSSAFQPLSVGLGSSASVT